MPHHEQPHQPEADPAQAKHDIFTAAHEVFGLGYAKPVRVGFWYESCRDNGGPPYQATLAVRMKIIKPWTWKQVDDKYREGLLRLPGWSDSTGGWKTHSAVITKGDLHIDLPTINGGEEDRVKNIYGFSIYGPCTITQDMRHVINDPDGPKDRFGEVGLATDPQDYTKEFE